MSDLTITKARAAMPPEHIGRRNGDRATIVQHCAVFGILQREVRRWSVGDPRPYAQYPVSVAVSFCEPRKRNSSYVTMTPDNIRYLTVIERGVTVYDSRSDVPCDMSHWAATRARFEENPAMRSETV